MKFFIVATRDQSRPQEDFLPHMEEESDHALQLYKEGFIRELYGRTDGKGALLVVEAVSEEEALKLVNTLPFAKLGFLSFDIYGTAPYRGFIRSIN